MRKRFSVLLLPAVLLCSLLVPAQAIAAPPFSVTIERDTCVAGAGKYHFGQGVLRVRIIEYGKSGATKFTWVAQVWHLPREQQLAGSIAARDGTRGYPRSGSRVGGAADWGQSG